MLSHRERVVLGLLAEGLTYDQIARREFVSRNTVKSQVSRIYCKLGVHNAAHAVAVAYRMGIIGWNYSVVWPTSVAAGVPANPTFTISIPA